MVTCEPSGNHFSQSSEKTPHVPIPGQHGVGTGGGGLVGELGGDGRNGRRSGGGSLRRDRERQRKSRQEIRDKDFEGGRKEE